MQYIKFKDDIKVERATGVKDDWGNETTEKVFEGKGRYQQGSPVYTGILTTNSLLFVKGELHLKENDIVYVTLRNGVRKRGVVGEIRYIEGDLLLGDYTRMVLKQVQDANESNGNG